MADQSVSRLPATIERLELIVDVPTRARVLTLMPELRQNAVDAVISAQDALHGENCLRCSEAQRGWDRQETLFLKGRKKNADGTFTVVNEKLIVTKAHAYQSYHCYGLAMDYCMRHKDGSVSFNRKEDLDKDGVADWTEVAERFKAAGWEWGGEWNTLHDYPHVQFLPPGLVALAEKRGVRPWKVLYEMRMAGKVDSTGYVVIPADWWTVKAA